MKFSIKSLLVLLLVAAAAQAKSICSSQLDYLHTIADKLEEKVFSDTVSTIEYRENIHCAGETFTIKLFQKPCLVVDNVVKRVSRTVCIRDSQDNFVDQRLYVVDCTAGNKGFSMGTVVFNSLWYTFCYNVGFALFLADLPSEVRNVLAVMLGFSCGIIGIAEQI
jgi:hypothetical protein